MTSDLARAVITIIINALSKNALLRRHLELPAAEPIPATAVVAAALENSVEELGSQAPAEHLRQAGAVAKAHASGVLQASWLLPPKQSAWRQSPRFAMLRIRRAKNER